MKRNNPSHDQLNRSLERRTKHLMIQVLEKFEDIFSDMQESRDSHIFKGDLRTAFNDVIRAQRDELNDYEVEYRPLRVTDNNTLVMTQTFMQAVQKIDFGFRGDKPYIKIYSGLAQGKVLDALRLEFGTGVIVQENDTLILEIVGVQTCIDCVLIILDKYRLHDSVRKEYCEWRRLVVEKYRS